MSERSRYTDVLGWVPLTRSDCPGVGPSYALSTTQIDHSPQSGLLQVARSWAGLRGSGCDQVIGREHPQQAGVSSAVAQLDGLRAWRRWTCLTLDIVGPLAGKIMLLKDCTEFPGRVSRVGSENTWQSPGHPISPGPGRGSA